MGQLTQHHVEGSSSITSSMHGLMAGHIGEKRWEPAPLIDRLRCDRQQASRTSKTAEWGSEAIMLLEGEAKESSEPGRENRDVMMIGTVPCRLSSEVHVDG
jgi:hypothetical protein